ncbi:MAG: hypothetical protein IIX02_04380, partial [Clostridia bacterium]|nr:hypothetical protein [Clostridia bacterium]
YKIERSDYATHTTLYEGIFTPEFIDDTIEKGKNYTYTVTPIYKENVGKKITLPCISTQENSTIIEDKKISETEWWNK